MLGPAPVESIDGAEAASCSNAVVRRARERLGFSGTLVGDDLDAVSILRGRRIGEAAVARSRPARTCCSSPAPRLQSAPRRSSPRSTKADSRPTVSPTPQLARPASLRTERP